VSITDLKLELVCLKKHHNRISNQFLDALESAGYDVKSSAEVVKKLQDYFTTYRESTRELNRKPESKFAQDTRGQLNRSIKKIQKSYIQINKKITRNGGLAVTTEWGRRLDNGSAGVL
jgi:ribonuclease I